MGADVLRFLRHEVGPGACGLRLFSGRAEGMNEGAIEWAARVV